MSLKRRVCRFAATPPSDHIWISDEILDHAFYRYLQLRAGRRHGSAVPGPLEARKRVSKRRIMDLAPTAGGPDLHPGFLAGLGGGQENQQSWQWQTPKVPQSKDPPPVQKNVNECVPGGQLGTNPSANPGLPAWLANLDHKDKRLPVEEDGIPVSVPHDDRNTIVPDDSPQVQSESEQHCNPEAQLKGSTDLGYIRKVIISVQEHSPLRKICSRQALLQLLESGCNSDKILEFWVDPILNPWRAENLSFFIAYCVEFSKVEEMRRFCEWTARQFHVGMCPDRTVLLLITELSNFRDQDEWQKILINFSQRIAHAVQSSPVLHVEHLEPKTFSNLLAFLFGDIYSSSMLDLGFGLVQGSSSIQRRALRELVGPIMEHWLNSWEPSRRAELSSATLSSKITGLLHIFPQDELLKVIRTVSWQILHHPFSEGDLRVLWQRHTLWWSAIQSPSIFQHVKKSKFWLEISSAIRKRQETEIESMALTEINDRLNQDDVKGACRTFLRHPQLILESCPTLAEALILDPNQDWKIALVLRESRQGTVLVKLQTMSEDYSVKELQLARVHLLERMALAYGQQEHIPVAMIFYYAYGCWKLQKRDGLGPVRPAMARALTLCGMVRQLQARQQVSRQRMEWILRMVSEVEGTDESRKLGITVCEWLEEGYRQSRYGRDRVLQHSLGERHHEQGIRMQETGLWDGPMAMASAQPIAPARYEPSLRSAYQVNPVLDIYSASLALRKGSRVRTNGAESTASLSPFEHLPLFSPDTENDDEYVQQAEKAAMTAQGTATAASVDSNRSTSPSALSHAARPYHVPTEIYPPASSLTELQLVPEHTSRDVSWNVHVRDRARRARYLSLNYPPYAAVVDAPSEPMSRYEIGRDTRDEAMNRHIRGQKVHSLFIRLNTVPREMSELSPIPPCSLRLIAANPTVVGRELSNRTRRQWHFRSEKATPTHGMKEYEGPSTLSSAIEPALGRGFMSMRRVFQQAKKHLKMDALGTSPIEPRVEENRISGSNAWWDRDD
ncbi:MAG: hypothetical protein Q9166_000070 [cf. Caloplaca sp. 2 TL-2023]